MSYKHKVKKILCETLIYKVLLFNPLNPIYETKLLVLYLKS